MGKRLPPPLIEGRDLTDLIPLLYERGWKGDGWVSVNDLLCRGLGGAAAAEVWDDVTAACFTVTSKVHPQTGRPMGLGWWSDEPDVTADVVAEVLRVAENARREDARREDSGE